MIVSVDESITAFERCVLVLEDRRFFAHTGHDRRSIVREVVKALVRQRHGGASTIDMQVFRVFSGRYERTIRRKLREIVGAYALQKKLSKIEILRAYLANAYFGTGLIGADAAAMSLFSKNADRLSLDEAAQIAAMLVYPKPRVPSVDWQAKVRRRADYGGRLIGSGKYRFNKLPG